MDLALLIYAAGVVGKLDMVFGIAAIAFIFFSLMVFSTESGKPKIANICIRVHIAGWLLALLTALLPSERTVWLMAGGYAAQQVAQSEKTHVIIGKVDALINKKLDELLEGKK